MKFVEEWKEIEVNKTYEMYLEFKNKLEELRTDYKNNGGKERYNAVFYFKYSNKTFYAYTQIGNQEEENIKRVIRIQVEKHFEALQEKVEKVIGKIIEIESFGNYYKFIGENGNCNVDVILAGGYNVQKLHTRWLIKK